MRKRKYIINFVAAVLLIGCNESLEDTYGDYAGDGKIRYVAKCSEVHLIPRWEGLLLEWKNGTDAMVDKIKVIWTIADRKDSVLLPNSTTSYQLTNIPDGTYRFDICAMDAKGNESLRETTYGRPYTRDHEVMQAFTRGVVKSYFLKNKMIFISDKWNNNIVEMKLKYKDTQGNTKYYEFEENESYDKLLTIDDMSMDPRDTVYVIRKGKVEDCPDEIYFDPFPISRKKTFSAGFVNAVHRRYGYSTETKEKEEEFEAFVESVTELEFDYDIETFEDVLYCPNLKKIILGKNRYLNEYIATDFDRSKLTGPADRSIRILNKANEVSVLGLTIDYYGDRYNKHYFDSYLQYMTYKGYPVLPEMEVIKKEALRVFSDGNRILCTPKDPYAKLENLLDDNAESGWITTSSSLLRTYEMQMELLEPTEISGIKVAQLFYDPWMDERPIHFTPSSISIQVSLDGVRWENVTFFETNELGRGSAEVTLLPIVEKSRQIRFVKFTLRDGVDNGGNCMINLGDIVLYK